MRTLSRINEIVVKKGTTTCRLLVLLLLLLSKKILCDKDSLLCSHSSAVSYCIMFAMQSPNTIASYSTVFAGQSEITKGQSAITKGQSAMSQKEKSAIRNGQSGTNECLAKKHTMTHRQIRNKTWLISSDRPRKINDKQRGNQ